jgi:magnesium transporter
MKESMVELEILLAELEEHLKFDDTALTPWLANVHPADIAALMNEFNQAEQVRIYSQLGKTEHRIEFLGFLDGEAKVSILEAISPQEIATQLILLPPDEAVDLIEGINSSLKTTILSHLSSEIREEILELSRYVEGTAGSVMTTEFLHLGSHSRIRDALEAIKQEELESIEIGYILTAAGKILGHFSMKSILVEPEQSFLLKFIDEDFVYVHDTDTTDVVLQMMTRHSLIQIPVVDHSGTMKGIITADDMLEVAKDLMDADFYHMVGTSGDPTERSIWARSIHRMPWLASTLLGGTLAAAIQIVFKPQLELYSVIVIFIPFVIGMAGNVGVQSATIIVRELVNQDTSSTHIRRNVTKEILTGGINALLFSLITFVLLSVVSTLVDWKPFILATAVAVGLFGSIAFAALIGATIPIIFTNFKIDPAISSGPIITVTTDVIGLSIYLLTATVLLSYLGIDSLHLPDIPQLLK